MSAPTSPRPLSVFGLAAEAAYTAWATLMFCLNTFVLICPLILLIPGERRRRRLAAFGVRFGLMLMGAPFRVRGAQHLPAGPCIVVSNHASYLDGMVMTAALPSRFVFVIQHGVARWFYAGAVLRRLGYRFVNRESARAGAAQTKALLRGLRGGESLAIFAEGTFQPEPGLLAFKNGAFLLAAKAGVPVVPVAIRGTRRLLGGPRPRFRWSAVTVQIGEPLSIAGLAPADLRDLARARVLAMCGEPDAAPAAPMAPVVAGDDLGQAA